jgi:uncharacterized membrane protein YgdD (TMEM256/DUF423 family)
MIHALAIIIISLNHRKFDESKLDLALGLFLTGIIIFSGSLYLLATRSIWGDDSFRIIGAITPLGGVAFISGWLLLFFKGFAPEEDAQKIETGETKSRKHRHRSKSGSKESTKEESAETN